MFKINQFIRRLSYSFQLIYIKRRFNQAKTEQEQHIARQKLTAIFADARGITMKIGQLIADNTQQVDYKPLLEGIKPQPKAAMMKVLKKSLGNDLKHIFCEIDDKAIAASLGQVYRGRLVDGTEVAIKIRYPDIEQAISAELKVLGLMPALGPVKRWGFDLNAYRQVLYDNMQQELNYLSEAQRQINFAKKTQIEGVKIPLVFKKYSTQQVLVQSFEQGETLDKILNWDKPDRFLIGRALMLLLFKSLFVNGEVHADPHQGNLLYRRNATTNKPELVLLDFGCTVKVSPLQRLALLKLLIICRQGNNDALILSCYLSMGFNADKLAHIAHLLPNLTRLLFKPYLIEGFFDLKQWQLKQTLNQLLGEHRWWFRAAGPAELFLLMRAFQGLIHQLDQLQIQLPWWLLLEQAVGQTLLTQAQQFQPIPAPKHLLKITHYSATAKSLCIEIKQDGIIEKSLKMPATMALELETIIPKELYKLLKKDPQINFSKIKQHIQQTNLQPQTLFKLQKKNKIYHVWLE